MNDQAPTSARPSLPVYVVGCQVMENVIQTFLPQVSTLSTCRYLEFGLHEYPKTMTPAIQAALDELETPGIVLIGYGLCGNGIVGLQAGKHTLIIPRVDDCIALFMGSYELFREHHMQQPATYYLTKGWLEGEIHPISQFNDWAEIYGEEKARHYIDMMYANYERVLLVTSSPDDMDLYRPQAQEVADFLGLNYDELIGSDKYVEALVERAGEPGSSDEAFVVIPPGGTVQQSSFIR